MLELAQHRQGIYTVCVTASNAAVVAFGDPRFLPRQGGMAQAKCSEITVVR